MAGKAPTRSPFSTTHARRITAGTTARGGPPTTYLNRQAAEFAKRERFLQVWKSVRRTQKWPRRPMTCVPNNQKSLALLRRF